MDDIRELRATQNALTDKMQELLDSAEGRDLTDKEQKEFDKLKDEHDALHQRASRIDALKDRADFLNQSIATAPHLGQPGRGADCYPDGPGEIRGITGGLEQRSYSAMFASHRSLDDGGFRSFGDFMRAVHSGHDPRVAAYEQQAAGEQHEKRAMGITSHIVPEKWAAEIFDAGLEDEIVRPRCRVYAMDSETLNIPGVAIGNHANARFGSLLAYWTSEHSAATESQVDLRTIKLQAQKLIVYGIASNEVLEDGIGMEETIFRTFAEESSWKFDVGCLKGTGAGEPLGVLNSACLITVDAEAGQAASTICYLNVTKMLGRLHPACFSKAVWVAHISCIPELLNLQIPVGTGGSFYPVLSETSAGWKMLTRPVIFTEKNETLGTKGDLLLADFSHLALGIRATVDVRKSEDLKFREDQTCYRARLRADAQPLWDEALTLSDGTTTVSPFVCLEAR